MSLILAWFSDILLNIQYKLLHLTQFQYLLYDNTLRIVPEIEASAINGFHFESVHNLVMNTSPFVTAQDTVDTW